LLLNRVACCRLEFLPAAVLAEGVKGFLALVRVLPKPDVRGVRLFEGTFVGSLLSVVPGSLLCGVFSWVDAA